MLDLITEDRLRDAGFRWEQLERQPTKHWLLWLGRACREPAGLEWLCAKDSSDLGVELASGMPHGFWYCWIRSDFGSRYSRFLHVRNMKEWSEVVQLIEALTGRPWIPADVLYGQLWPPDAADRLRQDSERLDRRIAASRDRAIASQENGDLAQRNPT